MGGGVRPIVMHAGSYPPAAIHNESIYINHYHNGTYTYTNIDPSTVDNIVKCITSVWDEALKIATLNDKCLPTSDAGEVTKNIPVRVDKDRHDKDEAVLEQEASSSSIPARTLTQSEDRRYRRSRYSRSGYSRMKLW
jgi:hypothetical protein